jgi:excisionase family DNA binding protein
MTQNDDRLISALEVAYRASLHPATIYRKALRGEIPGLVRLGKTVRFKESEIDAWLKGETKAEDTKSTEAQ